MANELVPYRSFQRLLHVLHQLAFPVKPLRLGESPEEPFQSTNRSRLAGADKLQRRGVE